MLVFVCVRPVYFRSALSNCRPLLFHFWIRGVARHAGELSRFFLCTLYLLSPSRRSLRSRCCVDCTAELLAVRIVPSGPVMFMPCLFLSVVCAMYSVSPDMRQPWFRQASHGLGLFLIFRAASDALATLCKGAIPSWAT